MGFRETPLPITLLYRGAIFNYLTIFVCYTLTERNYVFTTMKFIPIIVYKTINSSHEAT